VISFAHIVNPVIVDRNSDLFVAQPVTFASMRIAKEFSFPGIKIELFTAQYEEDVEIIPEWFFKTKNLYRSVLDVGCFLQMRKLPLIKDILDRLYENSNADYFIYSNVDISLMPHFYRSLSQFVESGFDAFVINRRTISKLPDTPESLPLMWSQLGEKHPGYDCFIFKRECYPHYDFGSACIGANWIGRVLLANLYAYSDNFKIFEDCHLTFHLGDDKSWNTSKFSDYDLHNHKELARIMSNLKTDGKVEGKPLLEKFYKKTLPNENPKKRCWIPFRKI